MRLIHFLGFRCVFGPLRLLAPAEQAPPVAGRRVIVWQSTDLSDHDLHLIRGTSLPACQGTRLARGDCGAHTFNGRAMPASSRPRPPSPVSAPFRPRSWRCQGAGGAREAAGDLGFLGSPHLEAARAFARQLPREDPAGGADTLRLAQARDPNAKVSAMLDMTIARCGFRIVDYRVESDPAQPRHLRNHLRARPDRGAQWRRHQFLSGTEPAFDLSDRGAGAAGAWTVCGLRMWGRQGVGPRP